MKPPRRSLGGGRNLPTARPQATANDSDQDKAAEQVAGSFAVTLAYRFRTAELAEIIGEFPGQQFFGKENFDLERFLELRQFFFLNRRFFHVSF